MGPRASRCAQVAAEGGTGHSKHGAAGANPGEESMAVKAGGEG